MPSNTLIAEPTIDEQRMAWRKRLTEQACRELAAEYRGAISKHTKAGHPELVDPALADAYDEYMERYYDADQKLGRDTRKQKRSSKRRTSLYK